MKAELDMNVGIYTCSTGIYDRFLADDTVNKTCGFEWTYFDTVFDNALLRRDYNFLLNTCAEEIYEEEDNIIWIEWPSQLEDEEDA